MRFPTRLASVTGITIAMSALLTSCSSAPPPEGEKYGSVVSLRDAYVAAGGECDDWVQTNVVTLAAESGTCGGDLVLSTFANQSDRDATVSTLKEFSEIIGGIKLLVGANWIINSDEAPTLQPKLGGTIVDSTKD